jgi:steroid delta-isomerase-like uncharacterized protein
MNSEAKNKESIRNLYENILNNRHLEMLNELISENYVGVRGEKGAEGFRQTVGSLISGFPDIKWAIEDLLAEDDKVIVRWTWTGTHQNAFRGFPQTNRKLTNSAIVIYQFENNRIKAAWLQSDQLGFLTQIGVISPGMLTPPTK